MGYDRWGNASSMLVNNSMYHQHVSSDTIIAYLDVLEAGYYQHHHRHQHCHHCFSHQFSRVVYHIESIGSYCVHKGDIVIAIKMKNDRNL